MRLLALLILLALAGSVSAQVRVAYEVAPIAIRGDITDYAFCTFRCGVKSSGGEHRSISATLSVFGNGLGVRVAYLTFTDEDTGAESSYPGLYLNASFASEGSGVGGVFMLDVGYDYYNKEANGILGLLPTFAFSAGPRLGLGPFAIEASVGAQATSILQGIALTGRIGVAIGD